MKRAVPLVIWVMALALPSCGGSSPTTRQALVPMTHCQSGPKYGTACYASGMAVHGGDQTSSAAETPRWWQPSVPPPAPVPWPGNGSEPKAPPASTPPSVMPTGQPPPPPGNPPKP